VALSRGFPRVDLSTTSPFDVRTFLEGKSLRGCLTRKERLASCVGCDNRPHGCVLG
jgi:hypothetical protein